MEMKFKIIKGKWKIGNLNDILIASKFDLFINKHREFEQLYLRAHSTKELKKHNYVYNYKNQQ